MQVFTRRASESDCEVLESLESEARANLDHFRGGIRLGDEFELVGKRWANVIADKSINTFVAGVDKTVMGYLVAKLSQTKSGKIATIEQVFVTKDARNVGIGDALVSATIAWAKAESLVALDGFALPGDRETKNLFERSGLVARLITVTTDLKN
ncbi:MAG: N-acetyltransferase family protein [Acidimicrobiaceae bacterium]